jgi:ABC-type Na+ efflux pump permease subunit
MSSRSPIIFRKEFREIFRDRRTLMSVIIGPLLITPSLFQPSAQYPQQRLHPAHHTDQSGQ